ncbi:MAG: hypothetical protein FVQ83_06590 [Chloroflexi bacterium]|nr:hypothetical protein [Chloroflexota bacterium]
MSAWISETDQVPENQENIDLEGIDTDFENENIPKSSIIALSFCLAKIIPSENIPDKFKSYLMDIVFRLYFKLRRIERMEDYAKVLLLTFQNNPLIFSAPENEKFRERISQIFENDFRRSKYPREQLDEIRAMLK